MYQNASFVFFLSLANFGDAIPSFLGLAHFVDAIPYQISKENIFEL